MFKVSQLIADFPVYTTISLSSTNHPLYSFHIYIELAIRERGPGGGGRSGRGRTNNGVLAKYMKRGG